MENPHIEEIIRCRSERRGTGKDNTSPIRIIDQVFTKEGELIMEFDPAAIVFTPEQKDRLSERLTNEISAEAAFVMLAFFDGK